MLTLLAENWWALAIRGVAAIIFGILAILFPGITLTVLVILFASYALVDGVFSIVAAIKNQAEKSRWWALLLEGILGIAVGIFTLFWPGITELVWLSFIAAWAILTGILEIIAAIRLRQEIEGEWLLILGGIGSVIFGILLVTNPLIGAVTIALIVGIYALIFGFLMLGLAFRMRSWLKAQRTA
jgi:uncharacterized membrane protein HdeD (DUF308 family)